MNDITKEIKKIKFHLRLLSETIDSRNYPIPSLVVEMDWDGDDLNRAHDIFEKYDKKLEAGETVNWTDLEIDLKREFDINYQIVKSIVLAFYRNHQWTEVCKYYAKSHMCIEFHEIGKDKD